MTQVTVTITGSEEIVTAGDKKFRVVLVPCEDEKPEYEFIPGKLYMSSYGAIVMCKSVREHEFSGMVLKTDGCHQIGQYRRDWLKSKFTPYTGTITL